jgi:hypothetical protein
MLYKWLLKAKSCGAKQNYRYVEEVGSARYKMKNLLSMARGFAVNLYSRVMSYVASISEKRAYSELPLFVRPQAISPNSINKGITSGLCFLKRPGVGVWPMPELEASTTEGVNSPPRRRTRANGNA